MRVLDEAERRRVADEYDRDGFAYVRSLFEPQELAPLADALSDGASPGGFTVPDSTGGRQELSAWLDLGDDFVGVVPRLRPVVDLAMTAIGGDVHHWHSKLSWKRPNTSARWDWHQDHGFWIHDGVARPDMCTIAVAIGPVTVANGCMQLVRSSHRLGTIEVVPMGPSQGSDPDVVAAALESHDVESCELDPGDAVVFHANTLHSSGPNRSAVPRTMLMMSYNAASNPPSAPRHPGYAPRPLAVLPASALRDGWDEVFGSSALMDPAADGLDQGYDIGAVG